MSNVERTPARSAEEVVSQIESGMTVFVHGAAATPLPLLEALSARHDLRGVRLVHLHTEGQARYTEPGRENEFQTLSLFTGQNVREAVAAGRVDHVPVFLSDIPRLFASGAIKLDAAILQLSVPDRHGICSLGTSCDAARAAADVAPLILAEVNDRFPRTHGATAVPSERITAWMPTSRSLPECIPEPETPTISEIGEQVSALIEDGACLQTGIGSIPSAILARLTNKNDLGIHTELLTDGVVDLCRSGVVTNRFKSIHPGRSVTSFANGTKKVYHFIHDNPLVEFHPCDRTNDANLIRKIDRMVAINSALQIDLTGQVCADSIGHRIYSGIGGQMDFMRGAAESRGGKPIIALPSTAQGGSVSRIVPELSPGAGVVTTRGHIHWVVTEFGAVNLHGKSLRERAELLIGIAHPSFRPELKKWITQVRHYLMR